MNRSQWRAGIRWGIRIDDNNTGKESNTAKAIVIVESVRAHEEWHTAIKKQQSPLNGKSKEPKTEGKIERYHGSRE